MPWTCGPAAAAFLSVAHGTLHLVPADLRRSYRSQVAPTSRGCIAYWVARPRRTLVLVVLAVIVVVAASFAAYRGLNQMVAPSASETLDRLPVIDRVADDPSYRRAAFGGSWADLDGDGCNTRDEVLLATVDRRQPYRVRRQGRCRADMVAGTWTDLYTGAVMRWDNLKDPAQAQAIPIDHIVPLAGAYRYGAKGWPAQQRVRFANDELNLTPTTAATNQDKTDHDPAAWTPPAAGRCTYATRYIAVKSRYDLPVDRQEKAALHRLLRGCG